MNAPLSTAMCYDCLSEPCECGSHLAAPGPAVVPRRTKRPVFAGAWAPVTFTRFRCHAADEAKNVRKRVQLNAAGELESLAPDGFSNGYAETVQTTLDVFVRETQGEPPRPEHAFYTAGVSAECKPGESLLMGKLDDDKWRSRSKKGFPFPERDALLTIDTDNIEDFPALQTPEDVVDVLAQLGLDADCGASPSGSSYLEWPGGKHGLRGLHTFYSIDKGAEVPRVLDTLHKRAWLAGYGLVVVGSDGKLHERSIVDRALASGNQPIFEFGAVLLDKRIQQPRKVSPFRGQKRQIVAADILPLTEEQEAQYKALVVLAKAEKQGDAEKATEAWIERRTAALPEAERDAARAALLQQRDAKHKELPPGFRLQLNDGRDVLVSAILADPDAWHRVTLPDPLEPEYGNAKATIFTQEQRDGRPKIISRAHGVETVYFLDPRPPGVHSGGFDPELFDDEGNTRKLEPFPSPTEFERPCYIMLDDWTESPGFPPNEFFPEGVPPQRRRPGLWLFRNHRANGTVTPIDDWICDPLHIDAQTYDGAGNNFGRLLRFRTTAGKWRTWALPMELVGGDPAALMGTLLGMGLGTDGTRNGKQRIVEYLTSARPTRHVRCVPQTGWTGDTFVLPDRNIGPKADDTVLQSEYIHGLTEMHGTAGTFDGWREGISLAAVGNPLLVLALSVAFAGPLLSRTHNDSGGIHFMGESSTGKTTILQAACSVWGGKQFKRTWLATANGLEGVAAMSNDCLLALDEISQCEPHHIGAVIYMIGNETGKQRANKSGAARTPTRHKIAVISTGERTITDAMLEGGKRSKAGQGVRLIDVLVGARFGCFDELHGHGSSKELVDAIAVTASQHYGHAGRRFLESLVSDERDLVERLATIRARPDFNPDNADGQCSRVASRFALFALAGELATEYGVTGWATGTATQAAVQAFKAWHAPRGKGSAEKQQAFRAILAFLERHGDARFSDVTKTEGRGPVVRDRAGWFRYVEVGGAQELEREHLFNGEGIREALAGLDFNSSIRALSDAGVLPPADKDGKHTKVVKVGGESKRVYPVLQRKLEAALEGMRDGAEVREYDPFADG